MRVWNVRGHQEGENAAGNESAISLHCKDRIEILRSVKNLQLESYLLNALFEM